MAIEKILGIGQPEAVREFLSEALQSDYEVTWAATIAEGWDAARAQRFDLVIADADAPDFEGLSGPGQKAGPEWPTTIVIASPAQREAAVKALNDVAFTYLLKPFSREELSAVIRRAAEHNQIFELCHRYGKREENSLLGDSFVSGQLRTLLTKVAQTNIPVLVRGQSGVGKELVARLIHRQGARADGPFVKLECASIADESIESHLFGWSVWGPLAQGKRPQGVLELAAGGTLLIDEISLLPAPLQARLLKVLQEKKFQRTEGTRWMALDARIIATTTRELEKEVERKAFNEQLFHALNVVPIWVPPLKDRPQDIRALASTFAKYFARKYGSPFEISREAIARFEHTDWTCNVRQLQIAIEQNVLGHSGFPAPTLVAHRGSEAVAANSHSSSGDIECLDELEKRHILAVLARCNGNRTLAAKRLGISIRTIRNKLKLYRTQQPNIELMPEAV